MALEFSTSFSLLFCWGKLLQGRTAEKNLGLSADRLADGNMQRRTQTSKSSEEFRQNLVIVGAELDVL